MALIEIVMIVVAYLLGSIPFGWISYRLVTGSDIRETGSGNIGATNVARSAGALPGILTLAADILKGFVAVAICFWVGLSTNSWAIAFAALAAVAGHMFPVWLRFRGGKGVATGLGVFLALAWHVALMALAVFVLVVLIGRIVSLGSIIASLAFIVLAFALGGWLSITPSLQVGALLCGVLIIARHYENIGRLLKGTEKRFSLGKSKPSERQGD